MPSIAIAAPCREAVWVAAAMFAGIVTKPKPLQGEHAAPWRYTVGCYPRTPLMPGTEMRWKIWRYGTSEESDRSDRA
jgi:hypothetical protein